ncbi:MAG TPA: AAA family ATPase [Bacteroidales bacterium]|nr:AAA family ATPase [Bacteroidales bacterium]HPS61471.1 AAA family ATPase [Bacteroidales bacterium]
MKIESIRLKNYKTFRTLELNDLPPVAVFVGANGSGKSTLFDVFGFLRDALNNNVRQALQQRGGFKEMISRGETGNIEIELKFKIGIAGKERLVTYILIIAEQDGFPIVEREILRYKRGSYGSPYHFLDFSKGEGFAITNEELFDKKDEELAREFQTLGSPDILAIKGLGQFQRFKAANAFRTFIENWHVSDFHITEARPSQEAGYAEHLSPTGNNLPLVTQFIYEKHPAIFDRILQKMKERVPGVSDVKATSTEDGRIILKFQDGSFKDPFIARFVSDGTIKMFAYLVLLYDPKPHPLLCIEEPENQLYPTLMEELMEEFRDYSFRGGQVFISTHSPDLLNHTELTEAFWLVKNQGFTEILRARDNEMISALAKEGNLLGYLWKQEYFNGSHPK